MRPVIPSITAYLSTGGLFNPELANHEIVRDLLIDCREEIGRLRELLKRSYRMNGPGHCLPEDPGDLWTDKQIDATPLSAVDTTEKTA